MNQVRVIIRYHAPLNIVGKPHLIRRGCMHMQSPPSLTRVVPALV